MAGDPSGASTESFANTQPSLLVLVLSRLSGRGGRETVLSSMLEGLHGQGSRVALGLLDHADDPSWEAGLPPVVTVAGVEPDGAVRHHLPSIVAFVRRAIQESHADAVVVTEPLAAAIVRLASLGLHRRPPAILSWFHIDPNFLRHRWAIRWCDAHLAICAGVGERLRQYGRKPVYIIYNPLDDTALRLCPRPPDNDIVRLLFIGRLHTQKRVDRILEALAEVGCDNWRLQVVGDGPDRVALHALAGKLGLAPHIQWSGWMDDPWSGVATASLLLLTSAMEGFGLILVEALARGVPVAAMDCDFGPREIIQTGKNGWLIDQGDTGALAHLIDGICRGVVALPDVDDVVASADRFRPTVVLSSLTSAISSVCGGAPQAAGDS